MTRCFFLAFFAFLVSLPAEAQPVQQEGTASYYHDRFNGRKTATGERFSQDAPTAASRELPLGTNVTVTNQENGKSVDVRINDRGPYVDGRIIDLSKSAARELDMVRPGLAPVTVEAHPEQQPTPELKRKIEEKAREPSK